MKPSVKLALICFGDAILMIMLPITQFAFKVDFPSWFYLIPWLILADVYIQGLCQEETVEKLKNIKKLEAEFETFKRDIYSELETCPGYHRDPKNYWYYNSLAARKSENERKLKLAFNENKSEKEVERIKKEIQENEQEMGEFVSNQTKKEKEVLLAFKQKLMHIN